MERSIPFVQKLQQRAVIGSLKVLPQRYLSHFAGRVASLNLPPPAARAIIRAFFGFYGVNFDEVKDPLDSFTSVQSFFTRALREEARPIDRAADAFVSPCDGAWGTCGTVEDGQALQVKGRPYSVRTLLDDDALAERFWGGSFATFYLSPRDYHRFHAPCDGDVVAACHVPGALWPVNAAGLAYVDGLFARNERIIAFVEPRGAQGLLALVAVGATMVGKVKVTFDDLTTNVPSSGGHRTYGSKIALKKGEEWGRFEFGSTIVVVATKGLLHWDAKAPGTPLTLGRRVATLQLA